MELTNSVTSQIKSDFLQHVFNSIPDAVVIADKNRSIISVNQTFEKIFGYREEQVRGKKTEIIYASEDEFKQKGKTIYKPDSVVNYEAYEIAYQRKDGSVFPAETVGSVIKDASGNTIGYFGAIRDLSIQKENEQQLKMLAERLQLLVKITSNQKSSFDDQIGAALKLTTKVLGLEMGIVSNISGSHYTIEYYYPEDSGLEKGMEFDLGNTYCDITYKADDVVAIDHMGESDYEGHPCYSNFELESYIGIPLSIDENRFGTINFSSTNPRSDPFTKADKDMLRLLGEWVSALMERKKTEAILRKSRAKFKLISENSADMVCLHDVNGTYEYVSPSVEDLLGYSPEELVGKNPYSLFHPEDLQKIKDDSHNPAKAGHSNKDMQYRIKRKDGSYIWFETATEPIVNDKGKVEKLRTGSRDITKRKKLELLLKETNKLAEVGGWEFNIENKELYWTDEVYRIHELPVGQGIDVENAIDYYPGDAENKIQRAVTQAIEEGIEYDIELPLVTAKDNRKWVRAIGKVEKNESGDVYKLYGVFKDLTKRKELEDQLRDQNRKLKNLHQTTSKIYSVLGHDLKAPLIPIVGFADVVKDELKDSNVDGELLEYLEYIRQSATKMGRVINDLSSWAQMQTGSLKSNTEKIEVKKLVDEVIGLLDVTAKNKNIDLSLDCGSKLEVEADEQMIKTIVRNFVSNAIKFSNVGDTIEIVCRTNNSNWEIAVKDKGTGMTEETKQKLFGKDHPSEYGTNNETGSGIGLQLCDQLADLHRGEIIVNSEIGVGSEFILRVPFANYSGS